MHLASINSVEEQKNLEEHIQSFGEIFSVLVKLIYSYPGMADEHFWTSGTDQAEEGK